MYPYNLCSYILVCFSCVCSFVCIAHCSDGQIKVIEGNLEEYGRLEICSDKRWESLSDFYWDQNVARVACIELGFASTCGNVFIIICNIFST